MSGDCAFPHKLSHAKESKKINHATIPLRLIAANALILQRKYYPFFESELCKKLFYSHKK
jgi:hypothetical protein